MFQLMFIIFFYRFCIAVFDLDILMAYSVDTTNPVMNLTSSIGRLTGYFVQKSKDLKHNVDIQNNLETNPDALDTFTSIICELEDMETLLNQLKTKVDERKQILRKFQVWIFIISNVYNLQTSVSYCA